MPMPSPGRTAMSKVVLLAIYFPRFCEATESNSSHFLVYGHHGHRLQFVRPKTLERRTPSMSPLTRHTLPLLLAAGFFTALTVRAGDWPHWLGPNYNGSSPETGL